MRRTSLFVLLAVAFIMAPAWTAHAQETDLSTRDPSALIKRGDTYWVFGTGRGCPSFSSADRTHWTPRGPVVSAAPDWARQSVPGNKNNTIWAPDVRFIRGVYRLYYSVSTFGSNVSAIGLVTSPTLEPGSWSDQGMVIHSEAGDDFNTIDPCVFEGPDRRVWLSFGSFWSGIKLVELDPVTGKRRTGSSTMYSLAAHRTARGNPIEASYIHYRKGYYYLFVNWDNCCRGRRSTYNIRVGRSRQIAGPYVDRESLAMLDGGGTLLLGSKPDDGSGATFDPKVGPGHAGIFPEKGIDRFSFHYEYVSERSGRTMMEIGTLKWDRQGWPVYVPPR